MATKTKLERAQERVTRARDELRAAGEAMLVAMGATEQEQADATELFADCWRDDPVPPWEMPDAEWPSLLAGEIESLRETAAEDAQAAAAALEHDATQAGDVPDGKGDKR